MTREARPEDYQQLLEIQAECIRGLTQTYTPEEISAWAQYIQQEDSSRYTEYNNRVFEDEAGNVVGFASWTQRENARANLECLYTLPSVRGQGIGKLLLQEVESRLPLPTTIHVRSTMNALPFYEKRGYVRLGNDVSRAGFGVALLEKTIT